MFQQINDSFNKGTQQCMLFLLVCLFIIIVFFGLVDGFIIFHLLLKSIYHRLPSTTQDIVCNQQSYLQ